MRSAELIGESKRWDAVAALALCAGVFVAWTFGRMTPGRTPIDGALPLIVAALSVAAWMIRDSHWFTAVECAVPLLLAWSMVIDAERLRLLGIGVIAGAAFSAALLASNAATSAWRTAGFVIAGTALIRWIARDRVEIGREILLVAGCVLVALAFRHRTWGVMAGLLAALITPAIPARTVAIPFIVAIVIWIVMRGAGERTRSVLTAIDPLALLVVTAVLALFPWSGVAARALPYFWRAAPPANRVTLNWALAPGEFADIDLPDRARALVISGANALRMRSGTVVGRINGDPVIRMGGIADWGYARREQYWKSTDAMPHVPAGTIHGFGYDAWIDGAGRVPLSPHVRRVRVNVERGLPRDFRLQIEAIEVEQP